MFKTNTVFQCLCISRPARTYNRKKMTEFNILKHRWVPESTKLTDDEKSELLKKYNIDRVKLAYIRISDPGIKHINDLKVGDIIKIKRMSYTAKETIFYRVVVNG